MPRRRSQRFPVEGCPLTRRQLDVLRCGYRGLTTQQAALELGLQHSTARSHWHEIYRTLGVPSRGEALAMAVREGWLNEMPNGVVVLFRDRPEALKVTPHQRVYLEEFDRMLTERTDESVERVEAAFMLLTGGDRSRPGNTLDGFFSRLAGGLAASRAWVDRDLRDVA